jgi:hypothetical protein
MMATHPNKFITLVGYLIFVRNDGILIILIDNSSFYNKICTEHVKALERKVSLRGHAQALSASQRVG